MQKRPPSALAAALVALVALALLPLAPPAAAATRGDPAAAAPRPAAIGWAVSVGLSVGATADEAPARTVARAGLFSGVTSDRAAAGLVAFRRDPALDRVAQARADALAASGTFSHAAAGAPIIDPVEASGVRPYAAGEALGWANDPSTDAALARIRAMWLTSPEHRAIVLADWANYAGVGVAEARGRTLAVLVIADTPDRTVPAIRIVSASRAGATVTLRWTAEDPRLQVRTAGVGAVLVDYRVDGGPWILVRSPGGAGVTVLANVPADRSLVIGIRAEDRAGNDSPWATAWVGLVP